MDCRSDHTDLTSFIGLELWYMLQSKDVALGKDRAVLLENTHLIIPEFS